MLKSHNIPAIPHVITTIGRGSVVERLSRETTALGGSKRMVEAILYHRGERKIIYQNGTKSQNQDPQMLISDSRVQQQRKLQSHQNGSPRAEKVPSTGDRRSQPNPTSEMPAFPCFLIFFPLVKSDLERKSQKIPPK